MRSFSGAKSGARSGHQRSVGQDVGIVAEGKVKMTAGKGGKGEAVSPDFKYYVVMDFEATCWKEGQSTADQEIIEFPAVFIDASTLEPIDEFREFVRPKFCPQLSAYCTQLTSIQQEDIDNAALLPQVLRRFGAWLDAYGLQANPSSAIPVTCGNWDLRSMLPTEVRRKALDFHPTLGWWCNIKDVFSRAMGRDRAPGMDGMLKALRLPLVGHHHLGIDDCRNIARILQELLRRRGATVFASGGARPTASAAMSSSIITPTTDKVLVATAAVTERTSNLTMAQKKVLKLQKTLREIAILKQRRDENAPLEANQVKKIALEDELQSRLAELLPVSFESQSQAAISEGDHDAVVLGKVSLADAAVPRSAAVDADGVSTAPGQVEVGRRARPRGGRSGFRRKYDADH